MTSSAKLKLGLSLSEYLTAAAVTLAESWVPAGQHIPAMLYRTAHYRENGECKGGCNHCAQYSMFGLAKPSVKSSSVCRHQ